MVEKMWSALKSCKHQSYYGANDQLSELPDDLLLLIVSYLTMKEATRTSVVSRRWNYLWRCSPVLIFEDYSAMKRMSEDDDSIPRERSRFLRWVNQVVGAHLGRVIDELRVSFDLDKSCQSDMDKWLVFASTKQVKRLEMDFTPLLPGMYNSRLPKWRNRTHNLAVCLRSLCLKFVNVTTKDVDCLLHSCMVLEELRVSFSRSLRSVRAFGSPLQLKYLEVSDCPYLRTIDILAPNLLSFTHHGDPVELHIRNASLLSKVSVGHRYCRGDVVAYAFDSLAKYFSHLEYLSWHMQVCYGDFYNYVEFNLGINNPPVMTNLKHLELHVFALCEQSLLGWVDLIEASPLLQRLTLTVSMIYSGRPHWRKRAKRNGSPLKRLETLELYGDVGLPIDLEFATYVVENSIMLKDVFVVVRPLLYPLSKSTSVEDRIARITSIVPEGVKLTLNTVDIYVEPWDIKRPQRECR